MSATVNTDTLRARAEQEQAEAAAAFAAVDDATDTLAQAEAALSACVTGDQLQVARGRIERARDAVLLAENRHRLATEQAVAAAAAVEAAAEAEHAALVAARTLDWRRAVLDWLVAAETHAAAEREAKRSALALTSLRGGDETPRSWWVQEQIKERVRRIADFDAVPRSREQVAAWLGKELGVEPALLLGKKRAP